MIPQIGSTSSVSVSSAEPSDSLGKDGFLNRLITQLKNQDPLEPMEGTEFVTQLAQFSELDQIRELASAQGDLQNYMASLNNFAAVSLLGKEVDFAGDRVSHLEGTSTEIPFRLPVNASQVTVVLYDAQGRAVHTLTTGPMEAGNQVVRWNGIDESGQTLPSGSYRCDVVAKDDQGRNRTVEILQRGAIREVAFEGGVPRLRVDDRWISLSEIEGIRSSSSGERGLEPDGMVTT